MSFLSSQSDRHGDLFLASRPKNLEKRGGGGGGSRVGSISGI